MLLSRILLPIYEVRIKIECQGPSVGTKFDDERGGLRLVTAHQHMSSKCQLSLKCKCPRVGTYSPSSPCSPHRPACSRQLQTLRKATWYYRQPEPCLAGVLGLTHSLEEKGSWNLPLWAGAEHSVLLKLKKKNVGAPG